MPTALSEDRNELESLIAVVSAERCERAFKRLYELTRGRMFAIVLRVVVHRGQAEEVLQDLYVKVWLRSSQFDGTRGTVVQWLSSAASRAAIDALRLAHCRPQEAANSGDDDEPYSAVACPTATPEERYAVKQQSSLMLERLHALPLANRECLLLAYTADFNHQEIAALLGCPLASAKSRVRRGLQMLRSDMAAAA